MGTLNSSTVRRIPWNKGRLTGQKPPLKLREIWAIRTRLQMSSNVRELALFNLAIDSKLRACDLTRLQVQDVCMGGHVVSRATSMQQKTQRPVQFEVTEQTRQSVAAWISARGLKPTDYLFPSRLHTSQHLSTRQYSRIVPIDQRCLGATPRVSAVCSIIEPDRRDPAVPQFSGFSSVNDARMTSGETWLVRPSIN